MVSNMVSNLICGTFRIVGAVIVILGLYLVLWGKEGDQYDIKSREKSFLSDDEPKEPKIQREEVP
jgi:nitrogen fixation-related uncharacterized protein